MSNSKKYDRILIVTSLASGVAILAWVAANFPSTIAQETNIDLTSEIDEIESKAMETKEHDSLKKAVNHPEVKKYTHNAYSVSPYFYPAEWRDGIHDEVKIHVATNKITSGDWQTGQTWTHTGRYELKVLLQNGEVTSVNVTPLPDRTTTVTFSESEKVIINAAVQDAKIQKLLEGRKPIHPISVYPWTYIENPNSDCPSGSCAVVRFGVADSNKVLAVWINTSTNEVQKIAHDKGW